jgi:hypothetical protein
MQQPHQASTTAVEYGQLWTMCNAMEAENKRLLIESNAKDVLVDASLQKEKRSAIDLATVTEEYKNFKAKVAAEMVLMGLEGNKWLEKLCKQGGEMVEVMKENIQLAEEYDELYAMYTAVQSRELAKSDELNASYRRELQLTGELHQLKRRRTDDP